jgi:hypothetical protein
MTKAEHNSFSLQVKAYPINFALERTGKDLVNFITKPITSGMNGKTLVELSMNN